MMLKNEHVKYLYRKPKFKIKFKNNVPVELYETESKKAVFVSGFDKDNKFIRVGWSLCSNRDKFSKKRGLEIARGRCSSVVLEETVPQSIRDQFSIFVEDEKNYWMQKCEGAGLWNYKN